MTTPTSTTAPPASTFGSEAAAQQSAAAASATGASGTQAAASVSGANGFGMDKDAFLRILVEQLRHQDPSQPGDSQQYIEQMTQFSILEQMTNLSETSQQQT